MRLANVFVVMALWSLPWWSACRDQGSEETDAATGGSGETDAATDGSQEADAATDGSQQADAATDGGSPGGGQCAEESQSCSARDCCDGLMCCSGVPVPQGREYCSSTSCPISDRALKENFQSVDVQRVLQRVASLNISEWNYIADGEGTRHMGPMAQEFRAAFGLGASDGCIHTLDADGVILASIQALWRRVQALERENARLRQESPGGP